MIPARLPRKNEGAYRPEQKETGKEPSRSFPVLFCAKTKGTEEDRGDAVKGRPTLTRPNGSVHLHDRHAGSTRSPLYIPDDIADRPEALWLKTIKLL